MDSFGQRLRTERIRLGFSQEEMGSIGGVARNAQANYEKGIRNPDSAYLSAIVAAGVDVLYVLTGKRVEEWATLAPDEAALLDNYRASTLERRNSLKDMSAALARLSKEDGAQ